MSKLISQKKFLIDVPEGKKKERIDLFLTHHIENTTRSKIQKAIDVGLVKVNGIVVKSNYSVKPFDKIEAIQIISPRPEDVEPEEIPLDIVYEDDYLIVVNKPAGMVAHPAYANYTGTLVNALLHHTKSLSSVNEAGRPGIVHRIDKDTSGLLVVAKDDFTHAKLAAQFSKHTIEREYHAICWGRFKNVEGEIATKIARSKSDRKKFTISDKEGKEAVTLYKVIEQFEFTTYLKLNLKTGRTHQIRVHLSGIGRPILGDATYGGNKIQAGFDSAKIKSRIANLLNIMPRQALHAKTLGFIHPHTNELVRFDSELPDDFKLLLEKLRN
ncbi:MAG: RNA pseudouridine synthase [Ignavibacteriales bacterium UTCHB2]|jgi:23S rRNA pseudouridine1911/1915/1917 synthase|nr:MAG: Ribosomal large subunit pseudouridine synthase D [Ignavibacteria bacterium ADurb.Bin266]OQY73878.1 MAG: RNA pseudouridine synthase [Ignavibacteriales bacterium UTCHB2]HQI41024.1 RluA family pseudouridine synthase [Ignavibacteriaceae bacterium]HQJ45393.1 RluA family pseudouridine synthase [Ignavibacteriaceae bacterium]